MGTINRENFETGEVSHFLAVRVGNQAYVGWVLHCFTVNDWPFFVEHPLPANRVMPGQQRRF